MSAWYLSRFRLTTGLLLCVAPFVVLVPAFGPVPEDESTMFAGWCARNANCVTEGMWNQTLLPVCAFLIALSCRTAKRFLDRSRLRCNSLYASHSRLLRFVDLGHRSQHT